MFMIDVIIIQSFYNRHVIAARINLSKILLIMPKKVIMAIIDQKMNKNDLVTKIVNYQLRHINKNSQVIEIVN